MLQGWVIIPVALAYLGVLFAIAYYGDQRADRGRSIIANPYIYALSLGVYATAWTFYGSVGRAAGDGVGFLPIYIGPTLMMALWWLVMRKIIRISKANRITSLADFVVVALRQERAPGGARHHHRGDRRPPLHRAAAQGHLPQLHDLEPVPGRRPARPARGGSRPGGYRILDGAPARDVHDPVRDAAPGCLRAPRGPGRGDRLRVDHQAGRLSRGGPVRDLRDLRRPGRPLSSAPPRMRSSPRFLRHWGALPAATRTGHG